jgi:hypothetical protein
MRAVIKFLSGFPDSNLDAPLDQNEKMIGRLTLLEHIISLGKRDRPSDMNKISDKIRIDTEKQVALLYAHGRLFLDPGSSDTGSLSQGSL